MTFRVEKVVGALPGTIVPNTVYVVRTGSGFDLYVSDTTGSVAHALNLPPHSITVGPTAPDYPAVGDIWIDTN